MTFDLKKEIKEIAQIAKSCPEEFRQKCFEILLNDALARAGFGEDGGKERKQDAPSGGGKQFQSFVKENSVSQNALSNVFDFTSDEGFIQVSDFKQKAKSKQQIVIGLLVGVKSLRSTGIATVDDAVLRQLCETHHVLDRPNFVRYMKNNRKYFNPIAAGGWKLTPDGLKKAAGVINALGGEGENFKL